MNGGERPCGASGDTVDAVIVEAIHQMSKTGIPFKLRDEIAEEAFFQVTRAITHNKRLSEGERKSTIDCVNTQLRGECLQASFRLTPREESQVKVELN